MYRPPELRTQVYQYLVEPDDIPDPREPINKDQARKLAKMAYLLHLLAPEHEKPREPIKKHINNLSSVSKAFRSEFLEQYYRHSRHTFVLDASSALSDPPFRMPPQVTVDALPTIRHCNLKLLATPGIGNAFDPREANADHWPLRDLVFASLTRMSTLRSMTLTIQACPNQMWNPVWLWHFTSQAFKKCEVAAFDRIEFNLDCLNFVQNTNCLVRKKGEGEGWSWCCCKGHWIVDDVKGVQAIRPFSGNLYRNCRVCEPGSDDEDSD